MVPDPKNPPTRPALISRPARRPLATHEERSRLVASRSQSCPERTGE